MSRSATDVSDELARTAGPTNAMTADMVERLAQNIMENERILDCIVAKYSVTGFSTIDGEDMRAQSAARLLAITGHNIFNIEREVHRSDRWFNRGPDATSMRFNSISWDNVAVIDTNSDELLLSITTQGIEIPFDGNNFRFKDELLPKERLIEFSDNCRKVLSSHKLRVQLPGNGDGIGAAKLTTVSSRREPDRQEWEYRSWVTYHGGLAMEGEESLDVTTRVIDVIHALNESGVDGWELVGIDSNAKFFAQESTETGSRYIFKRPRK